MIDIDRCWLCQKSINDDASFYQEAHIVPYNITRKHKKLYKNQNIPEIKINNNLNKKIFFECDSCNSKLGASIDNNHNTSKLTEFCMIFDPNITNKQRQILFQSVTKNNNNLQNIIYLLKRLYASYNVARFKYEHYILSKGCIFTNQQLNYIDNIRKEIEAVVFSKSFTDKKSINNHSR
jgi:hypothetical protein